MCLGTCACLCEYMWHVFRCAQRPEEGFGFPGAGPHGFWEPDLDPLEKQLVPLTPEPALGPQEPKSTFYCIVNRDEMYDSGRQSDAGPGYSGHKISHHWCTCGSAAGEWTQQSGWIRHLPVQCRCCWWLCLSGCAVLWSEEQGDTLLSLWHPWVKTTHALSTGNHSPGLSEMHLLSQLKGIQYIGVGASSKKNKKKPNFQMSTFSIGLSIGLQFELWGTEARTIKPGANLSGTTPSNRVIGPGSMLLSLHGW